MPDSAAESPALTPRSPDALRGPDRRVHLALMGFAMLASVAMVLGVSLAMGGTGRSAGLAAAALAFGSVVTFLPGLLAVRPQMWGTLVFGCSVGRMVLVLLAGFLVESLASVERKPFWLSLVAGAVLLLIFETAAAIRALSALDAARRSSPPRLLTENHPA